MSHKSKLDTLAPSQHQYESDENTLKTGLSAIRWLLVLQVGSRLVSFLLNTAIARTVSQGTFAIANVQIQLLMNIILPLTREGFRRAVLRAPLENHSQITAQKLNNFTWLCVPLGSLLSAIITYLFVMTSTAEELSTENYSNTIWMVGLASFIECLAEPLYILAQHKLLFGARASIELAAIGLKSLLSFILIVYLQLGLISFGITQVIYSIVLVFGYWIYFVLISPSRELPTPGMLLPHRIERYSESLGKLTLLSWKESVDWSFSGFWLTFEWQTFQKMLLQEGEKVLLRGVETLFNQGIFAIVNVLGSLVVRMVFQWLEEGLYPIFSKLLVQAQALLFKSSGRVALLEKSKQALVLLSKLLLFVGLVLVCFGPNYSFLLLEILYTSKYSETVAPLFLSWYCVYILTMGLNGITEAFAHAAAPPRMLNTFNLLMIFQSILFVAASIGLLKAGFVAGLIISNSIVMVSRIIVSVWYIRKFFQTETSDSGFTLSRVLPRPIILIAFLAIFVATRVSESTFCSANTIPLRLVSCSAHISVGFASVLILLALIIIFEKQYLRELTYFVRNKDI